MSNIKSIEDHIFGGNNASYKACIDEDGDIEIDVLGPMALYIVDEDLAVILQAKKLKVVNENEKIIEFIMPDGVAAYSKSVAFTRAKEAIKITPGKWAVNDYFTSENSFFTDNKRNFCRCKLRKA